MDRVWFLGIAFAAATSLSCSGRNCVPLPCPVTQLTAHFEGGSIMFAIDGAAPEMHVLSASDRLLQPPALASGTCGAGDVITILNGNNRGAIESTGEAAMRCQPTQSLGYRLEVSAETGDHRALGVGVYAIAAADLLTSLQNESCETTMSDGTATLTVTRAEGGPAPYPDGVTADYVREFAVHIEGQAAESSRPNGCVAPGVSAVVDLQFAETAADAVNHPDATCLCAE